MSAKAFECVCACYVWFSDCMWEKKQQPEERGGKKNTHTRNLSHGKIRIGFVCRYHFARTVKAVLMLPAHHFNNTKYKYIHSFMLSGDTEFVLFLEEHFNLVFASSPTEVTKALKSEEHSGKSSPFDLIPVLRCISVTPGCCSTVAAPPPWCNAPAHLLHNQYHW